MCSLRARIAMLASGRKECAITLTATLLQIVARASLVAIALLYCPLGVGGRTKSARLLRAHRSLGRWPRAKLARFRLVQSQLQRNYALPETSLDRCGQKKPQ